MVIGMLNFQVLEKNEAKIKSFSLMGLAMVLGYISSMGNILGFNSPVNIVIVSISGSSSIPAFIAAALSYIINGNLSEGIPSICAMAAIVVIKTFIFPRTYNHSPFSLAVLSGSVTLFFGALLSLVMPARNEVIIYRTFAAALCFFLVFFSKYCYENYKKTGIIVIKGLNGIGLSILYVMLVATLTSVSLLGINLGRAFGVVVMLFAINRYKHIGGAVCGALATCGVILCAPDLAKNTLLLATSGLICGAFASFGIAAIIIVFIGVSLISLVTIGMNPDTFKLFADLIAGAVIYLAVPEGKITGALKLVGGTNKASEISNETVSSKLLFASSALSDVKNQISTVTEAMEKKVTPTQLGRLVKDSVCRECPMNAICWQRKECETKSVFTQLQRKIACMEKLCEEDIDKKMPECIRKELIANTYNLMYTNMLFEQSSSRKLREMREFLSTQLETMGDVLNDISQDVSKLLNVDVGLSSRASELIKRLGGEQQRACIYVDERKMLRGEIFYSSKSNIDIVRLTVELSDITGCELEMPRKVTIGDTTRLEYSECPQYSLSQGFYQSSSTPGQHSGDYFEKLTINNTESYIILSDGMGTGSRARLDSMFTVNLAAKLLTAGVSDATTVKLLNSVLQVKCWEESFATLDLIEFDLCGGYLNILKAGAGPSYLYRDGQLKKIEGYAFPLGILSDTSVNQIRNKLFKNDIIIVCSDGVSERAIRNVLKNRKEVSKMTADEISREIGESAINNETVSKHDDITVICSKISKK